jgi:CRP-like cAMP-binding protein
MAERMRMQAYAAGDVLFMEGTASDYVYLLARGMVTFHQPRHLPQGLLSLNTTHSAPY